MARPVLASQTAPAMQDFSSQLELALNSSDSKALAALIADDLQPVLESRYQRFTKDFPKVSWQVEPSEPLADGRPTLLIRVSGTTRSEGLNYQLRAKERIAVRLQSGRLVAQELVAQDSLLRSGERPLPVTLEIPDAVLTGSRYDVDLIVNEPLGQALLAGGLMELNEDQVAAQRRPNIALEPLGGGGLFKSVQAPQRPGSQTWALILVHPEGLVTATKRVRVVTTMPARSGI